MNNICGKRASKPPESRWPPLPMDTRNSRRVTSALYYRLDRNRISDGGRSGVMEGVFSFCESNSKKATLKFLACSSSG
ncbi:hypothetical protein EVAR_66649_1 [Eumeta japonica]|uniref:Uncharacterized protein n=1 Tax=Eumeta variegata TaxID=151549 RepID=A0A4C1ZKF3_EUMVA|nr:hypothetical protein EVAR_66649_1 [Eumeta japonica]